MPKPITNLMCSVPTKKSKKVYSAKLFGISDDYCPLDRKTHRGRNKGQSVSAIYCLFCLKRTYIMPKVPTMWLNGP